MFWLNFRLDLSIPQGEVLDAVAPAICSPARHVQGVQPMSDAEKSTTTTNGNSGIDFDPEALRAKYQRQARSL
jgi:hypothetical protein